MYDGDVLDVVVSVYLDGHTVLLVCSLLRRGHGTSHGFCSLLGLLWLLLNLRGGLESKVKLLLVLDLRVSSRLAGLGVSQVPLQLRDDPLLLPELLLPRLAHHHPAGDLRVELRQ